MSSSSYSSPEITSANHTDPSQGHFSTMYETQEDVLEDLTSRFILNLPDEELNSIERISFQVEQAHWYYEDFIREANPKFPSLPLKRFSAMLFEACPLLHRWEHEQAFTDFMQYKTRVPVCGAIMLDDTWEKCVLVKGWKSSSGWGFPKGKINEDEPPPNCAIREVLEETGYNLVGQLNPDHVIEMSIKEQRISLFIVSGVPEDYTFKTKTRKEISKIEWFRLADLPTWKRNKIAPGKFYLITPFISALKQFIREHKPGSVPRKHLRTKRVQYNESRPVNRHQRSPAESPSSSSQEANQESSSQSSSADNGEPQTPSPQAISTVANHVDIASGVDTETLDPHFARLLSGLTLSGAAATQKEDLQKSVVLHPSPIEQPAQLVHEPVTPIPAAPYAVIPHKTSISDVSQVAQSFQGHLPIAALPSTLPHTMSNPGQSPVTASNASPISPIRSSSGVTSRRTSSTADISPYLSRPTEIPSSAKHFKQIALLEAVATESARMSPMLRMRDAAVNGVFNDHAARYSQTAISVPPALQDSQHVFYSSGPGFPLPPVLSNPSHLPLHGDPFVIRPQTSQAVHRTSYPGVPNMASNMSMVQSQPSALMNTSRILPVVPTHLLPGQTQYRFPPQPTPSLQRFTPFIAPPPSRHSPLAHPRSIPIAPTSSVSHIPLHVPSSAPALSPMFNIPPQGSSVLHGNSLLSILNGNHGNLNAAPTAFREPA